MFRRRELPLCEWITQEVQEVLPREEVRQEGEVHQPAMYRAGQPAQGVGGGAEPQQVVGVGEQEELQVEDQDDPPHQGEPIVLLKKTVESTSGRRSFCKPLRVIS